MQLHLRTTSSQVIQDLEGMKKRIVGGSAQRWAGEDAMKSQCLGGRGRVRRLEEHQFASL